MTAEEIIAQLRDIHLPAELEAQPATGLAAWPFAALAIAVVTILLARLWIRNRWRRRARAELARILSTADGTTQWAMLLAFAIGLSGRSGRPVTLPRIAYLRPDAVTDAQRWHRRRSSAGRPDTPRGRTR